MQHGECQCVRKVKCHTIFGRKAAYFQIELCWRYAQKRGQHPGTAGRQCVQTWTPAAEIRRSWRRGGLLAGLNAELVHDAVDVLEVQ